MALLEKNSSSEISRRTQPFYAKKQSYNLGQQVQIEVDLQREFLDFENSRLVFEANYTKGATDNYIVNPWGASAFIKNLRVKTLAGQMIGHEIREYRAWYRMKKELTGKDGLNAVQSWDGIMEGASAQTFTADADRQYAHKFISHLFSIKQYYPAHFHQGIMIEFDIPSSAAEIVASSSTNDLPTITISDIKYVADLVQLKPEMENKMASMMEQQRLFADYEEVLTQENSLSNAAGENYDIIGIDGRVKSIFEYQVLDSARNGINEEYFASYSQNGLDNYRFKLGANYLNYENIKVDTNKTAEQVLELAKALGKHDSKAYYTCLNDSALQLNGDRFVVGVKVDKAQKNTDQTISSMIDKDRNNVRVELQATSADPSTSYTHIQLDKRIQILPGSIVRNVRS